MSERHFHGTRHVKGGFDIDESTLHPNAAYWRACARGEYRRVVIAIGEEKANHVVPERAEGQTWKDVYESVKLIADLAEKQVARAAWIEDAEANALDYADLKATQESALGRGW